MSRVRRILRIFASKPVRGQRARSEPDLTATDWQRIRECFEGETRALVSKSIIESIYSVQQVGAYQDRDVLLQAAANRLYADAMYGILSSGVKPPFEPAQEIMRWVREALEDAISGWQGEDGASKEVNYEPSIEHKRATTDAILAAFERASKHEVLMEAARRRVQVDTRMVAAE